MSWPAEGPHSPFGTRHPVKSGANGKSDHGFMSRIEPPRPAATPEPPYTAVIFTSHRTEHDNGYRAAAVAMEELAATQPGYLGIESAREDLGITVSYWRDEASARAWKENVQHKEIQRRGRQDWYSTYTVRIATVTRQYGQ